MKDVYGFVDAAELPGGAFTQCMVPGAEQTTWFTTSQLPEAKNHCAAVLVANLVAYEQVWWTGRSDTDLRQIYGMIGNGPVLRAPHLAQRALENAGFQARRRMVLSAKSICAALDAGQPCSFLLCRSVKLWHWVLAIGYRRYGTGLQYCIADGWSKEPRYLPARGKSRLVQATAYCAVLPANHEERVRT